MRACLWADRYDSLAQVRSSSNPRDLHAVFEVAEPSAKLGLADAQSIGRLPKCRNSLWQNISPTAALRRP